MGKHSEATTIHVVYNYSYASAAARTGASGFTSDDIGKIARQTDNNTFWILTATTPTWAQIDSGGSLSGPGSSTDEAKARFNGTGGDTLQNSSLTISDTNVLSMADNTLSRPKILDYGITHNDKGNVSGSVTIDITNGNSVYLTLTGNITTLTLSNPSAAGSDCSVRIYIEQGGTGSYTVAWGSVLWASATAPTLSTGVGDIDVVVLTTVDGGTTWFGFVAGLDMS
jgi:hypothetical protein